MLKSWFLVVMVSTSRRSSSSGFENDFLHFVAATVTRVIIFLIGTIGIIIIVIYVGIFAFLLIVIVVVW